MLLYSLSPAYIHLPSLFPFSPLLSYIVWISDCVIFIVSYENGMKIIILHLVLEVSKPKK